MGLCAARGGTGAFVALRLLTGPDQDPRRPGGLPRGLPRGSALGSAPLRKANGHLGA
jgi:hypothetical protein